MHGVTWSILSGAVLVQLATASPIANTPSTTVHDNVDMTRRDPGAGPSAYPYGTPWTNEMSWEGWNPNNNGADRAQGQQIHDAYTAVKEMTVYAWHEADQKTATFKRWFGASDADSVKKVLEQIMDMKANPPEALPHMKDRVLMRADYKAKCKGRKNLNAYTSSKSGKHHICPHGLAKPSLATLTCDKLDGDKKTGKKWSSKKIRTLAGTMFHEIIHWKQVGDVALGKHIDDIEPGKHASDCHEMNEDDQLINAQNYAFLASEAYMQKKGCIFIDPPSGTKETDDDDDFQDQFEEGDTKAISIIFRSNTRQTYAENDWYVYETPVGQSALCRPADQTVAKWSADDGAFQSWPMWPNGIFDINVDGMECQYKNDNTNPGALWCKDRDEAIKCYKDDRYDKKDGKFCDGNRIYQVPYVYCQW